MVFHVILDMHSYISHDMHLVVWVADSLCIINHRNYMVTNLIGISDTPNVFRVTSINVPKVSSVIDTAYIKRRRDSHRLGPFLSIVKHITPRPSGCLHTRIMFWYSNSWEQTMVRSCIVVEFFELPQNIYELHQYYYVPFFRCLNFHSGMIIKRSWLVYLGVEHQINISVVVPRNISILSSTLDQCYAKHAWETYF